MKVVILAGGMGSRLSEETQVKPKPMVEIGPYPILWHIMRHHEGRNAISSLELPAHEVKNRIPLAFDIPPHLAKMLIEYRNRLGRACVLIRDNDVPLC
jgi:NDP-sugar pyrophosphorylase family protein